MVEKGAFREDLFYRLEVIPLYLPPLRERQGDMLLIMNKLLEDINEEMAFEPGFKRTRLTAGARNALKSYHWPGNVRELENVIERTIVLSDGEQVDYQDLPLIFDEVPGDRERQGTGGSIALNVRLDEMERDLIARAMDEANHVKTKAASLLGIKTSALYYKLDKYDLE